MRATLYVGVAAPLVEAARMWLAKIPPCATDEQRAAAWRAFPHSSIGAYGLSRPDPDVIVFRTGLAVNEDRVRQEIKDWSGEDPQLLPSVFAPVEPIDHRRALAQLRQALRGHELEIVARVGLTLQTLQHDLAVSGRLSYCSTVTARARDASCWRMAVAVPTSSPASGSSRCCARVLPFCSSRRATRALS